MMITIKNRYITAKFSSVGAELKSLIYNGFEYIWQGSAESWNRSSPILFPICGGLLDDKYTFNGKEYSLKKHGFLRDCCFDVENISENSVTFLNKSDDITLRQFPFKYEIRVKYTVIEKSLKIDYTVSNKTDGTMYFSIGAHEGYNTPGGIEDYDIIFPEKESLNAVVLAGNYLSHDRIPITFNSNILSLKEKYFSIDALVFDSLKSRSATLKNRITGRTVRVEFPFDGYFLIWHTPGTPFICLEPWSGIPDYVDSTGDITEKPGIISLPRGAEFSHSHTVSV